MEKANVLKTIAETGYNVGFGAKKHFATFDVVETIPGLITFASIALGIIGLVIEQLAQKLPAAILTVIGVSGLYISAYDKQKSQYQEVGTRLTEIFNELRTLYRSVQDGENIVFAQCRLKELEDEYYKISLSKQIFLSDWLAHYKFFWQMQIDWINEQKNFNFWRDKMPLSLTLIIVFSSVIGLINIFYKCYILIENYRC